MPARRDHPPLAFPHGDHVAVPNAGEFTRRPQAQKFRPALGFHEPGRIIVRRAVSFHEGGKMLVRSFLALMPHFPAAEPFGQRQANRAFHFLHQISGEAVMIEMRMREGQVLQRAGTQQPPPQLVPDLEGVVGVHAAVDQRPSRPVVEQPAIDVIGRRRHREPHPEQSRQDISQFAVGRRTRDREFQIIGHLFAHPRPRPIPQDLKPAPRPERRGELTRFGRVINAAGMVMLPGQGRTAGIFRSSP